MQYFQEVDMEREEQRHKIHRELAYENGEPYDEEVEKLDLENILYVDSICELAIDLTRKHNYMKLGKLLDSNIGKFYQHPNIDSYHVYYFNSMMIPLYSIIYPDIKDFNQVLIDRWDYNRIIIEVLQAMREEEHPLYRRILNELISLYEIAGNQAKINETKQLLHNIEEQDLQPMDK